MVINDFDLTLGFIESSSDVLYVYRPHRFYSMCVNEN